MFSMMLLLVVGEGWSSHAATIFVFERTVCLLCVQIMTMIPR